MTKLERNSVSTKYHYVQILMAPYPLIRVVTPPPNYEYDMGYGSCSDKENSIYF